MYMKIFLNGKYPCLANWVSIVKKDGHIIAHNSLLDEDVVLSKREARFLMKLNGKRIPLKLNGTEYSSDEIDELLAFFDDNMLTRRGAMVDVDDDLTIYTIYIPRHKKTKSKIPQFLNAMLMMLWLPVLVIGLYMFFRKPIEYYEINTDSIFLTMIVYLLFGIMLPLIVHEMSHSISALAYGAIFLEAGFMLSNKMPGAYCLIDDNTIKNKFHKFQIQLAGIQSNCIFAGILFGALSVFASKQILQMWSGGLYYAALSNIILGLFNLSFAEGLDGEHGVSLIIGSGKSSIVNEAKELISKVFNGELNEYIYRYGIANTIVNLSMSLSVLVYQICFNQYALIVINLALVMGGIYWF